VFTVPEAFTLISNNGFSLNYFEVGGMGLCFQSNLMDLQMALEDSFERVLRSRGKPSVLLCDRGLIDGSAYMATDEWEKLLLDKGLEAADIREGRYNAVMHLVTAAEGAERYYTLENNEVRTESPDQAREVDRRSRLAWVGHPKLFVFDNSTDFEGKLQRLVDTIANLVGLPSKLSKASRKYLLRKSPRLEDFPQDLKYNIFEVEKVWNIYTRSIVHLFSRIKDTLMDKMNLYRCTFMKTPSKEKRMIINMNLKRISVDLQIMNIPLFARDPIYPRVEKFWG
jgi:hypothetical protein